MENVTRCTGPGTAFVAGGLGSLKRAVSSIVIDVGGKYNVRRINICSGSLGSTSSRAFNRRQWTRSIAGVRKQTGAKLCQRSVFRHQDV